MPLLDEAEGPSPRGPPFLLIHSTREWRALGRQNRLFHEALQSTGIRSELIATPTDGHRRTVLAMSRAANPVSAEILEFIRSTQNVATEVAAECLMAQLAPTTILR